MNSRGFLQVEFMYLHPYHPKSIPLAKGMGFLGVRGQVFAKWWRRGEHSCGRCNYHPPGHFLSETILYNVYTKGIKRQEDSIPQMWCNYSFIEKARYEENIPVTYDQSFILLIPSVRR